MKLFSGTSNRSLTDAVAAHLGIGVGTCEITRFIDNECRVFVTENVVGQDVYVLQSLSQVADQNLVELCLLGSALKELGAVKVTAVIPWLGYSKQDKAFRKGEAVSSQLVARFIEAAGFDAVIACELHSENVMPFFEIPVTEISTHRLLAQALPTNRDRIPEHTIVVSPDRGGTSRSEKFAHSLGLDVAYLTKIRDRDTGEVTIRGLEGSVDKKDVIVFDDIINTGETAVKTAEYVRKDGASSVFFLATHAVLAGDASALLSGSVIDSVIVTDTVDIPQDKQFPKLKIVSVSSLLADAMRAQTK